MPATIKITPAQGILSSAITEALAPFKAELAAACKRDLELAAAAEKIHPDKCKAEGMALMAQAVAGDDAAMKQLEDAGGLDAWVSNKSALYPVKEGARHHHACQSAELFERAAERLIPAIEDAAAKIQTQFESVMTELGELQPGQSEWGALIRNKCNAITAAVQQGNRGVGFAYLAEGLGLTSFLAG